MSQLRPAGIQELTVNGKTDIWPSWYNSKNSGVTTEKVAFNKANGKRAIACTPEDQRLSLRSRRLLTRLRRMKYGMYQRVTITNQKTCDVISPRLA